MNMDVNLIFNLEESGITLEEKIYNLGIDSNIPQEIVDDILKSEEINFILGDFFSKTIDYCRVGHAAGRRHAFWP